MRLPESVMTSASWGGVALVQVTLVALLGLVAWLLARRGGPALRSAVLLATLVGLLFLPGLAGLAPTWLPLPECVCPANIAPLEGRQRGASAEVARSSPSLPAADLRVVTVQVQPPPAKDVLDPAGPVQKAGEAVGPVAKAEVVFDLTVSPEDLVLPEPAGAQPISTWPLAAVLSAGWLLGVLFCLSRSARQLVVLYRCSWQAREIRDPEWAKELASLARRDGLPAVSLKESSDIASPLTLGLFRPVILLPPGRKAWSARERILILEHELAHIRRRDFHAGLVVELVRCLCWFHPLVLWLAARLRLEQEYAADAWVASVANDSRDYVRCLARLALEHNQGRRSLAPALWRRRPEILRRIDMLQNTPKGLPSRLSKWTTALVAAVAAAACLVVASVGPVGSDAVAKPAESAGEARPKEDPLGDPLPAGALAHLGTTRLRHQGPVTFVAFVPGGNMVTASQDNTIRLWDLAKRQEVRRFTRPTPVAVKKLDKGAKGKAKKVGIEALLAAQGNRGGSFQVALTADGKTLAAVGGNVVQLRELATGKELRKIVGPDSGLSGLIFSPDGRTLAGRTSGGAIHLWATDTGKEMHHIKPAPRPQRKDGTFLLAFGGGGGLSPAPGMAFTPDSKSLAVSAQDYQKNEPVRSVKFFDVASGKETRKIEAPKGAGVSSIAISQDGKLLAYGTGNTVNLRAADTGKEIHKVTAADGINMLVFSPDGKTLAVRGLNQRVRLWETQTGKELRQLNDAELRRQTGGFFLVVANGGLSGPEMRAVAISPDSKRVASAAGATVRVWEIATGKEVPLVESHWRAPSALVLSADGKTVASWGADRVVHRWQAATGKSLGSFPAPARTTLAVFSPDGRTVALANADNSLRLHDIHTGKELSRLKGPPNGTFALAFAPGGKILAARGNGDNTIRLYDLARKQEVQQLVIRPKKAQPRGGVIFFGGAPSGPAGTGPGLAFSPDGKLLATPFGGNGGRGNSIVFLDVATSKELRKIESPQPIASFAFSPDSRTLATENANGTITLWEVASGKQRGQLGQAVVAKQPAGNGGRMVLDVALDGALNPPSAAGGPVGVSFSPDGRALAVCARDRSVRIWDVVAGKEIGQLRGHQGGLQTVLFAANGKTLASGSNDTTVLLWDGAAALKNLARAQPLALTAEEVSSLWGDLAGTDATKASEGIHKLAAGAKQALPFLDKNLKPAARVELKKINGWLADLESEKFNVRQEAMTRLLKVGAQAVPPLKKLLASGPPLETRRRAEDLVNRLTGGTLTTEQLRVVRAVEALELIGSPEARRLLKVLADGGPGELPTREAQAALDRLASKP